MRAPFSPGGPPIGMADSRYGPAYERLSLARATPPRPRCRGPYRARSTDSNPGGAQAAMDFRGDEANAALMVGLIRAMRSWPSIAFCRFFLRKFGQSIDTIT